MAPTLSYLSHVTAKFFEPSIQCIVDAVIEQRHLASKPVAVGVQPSILIEIHKLFPDRLPGGRLRCKRLPVFSGRTEVKRARIQSLPT